MSCCSSCDSSFLMSASICLRSNRPRSSCPDWRCTIAALFEYPIRARAADCDFSTITASRASSRGAPCCCCFR
eukprot:5244845-Prymnesium_polylepis.1